MEKIMTRRSESETFYVRIRDKAVKDIADIYGGIVILRRMLNSMRELARIDLDSAVESGLIIQTLQDVIIIKRRKLYEAHRHLEAIDRNKDSPRALQLIARSS